MPQTNANVNIWNLLHDTTIVSVSGDCPGDITVKVEIGYLQAALATESKFLLLYLQDCSTAVYRPFTSDGTVMHLNALSNCEFEILSAKSEHNHVSVCCTEGVISLVYEDISCELDDGVSMSYVSLFKASQHYWKSLLATRKSVIVEG